MKPDDARRILAGVKKGDGFSLHGEWCDALKALAADTLEYKVETLYNGHWREPSVYADYYWLDDYNWAVESLAVWQKEYPGEQFRIVARRVSPEWVVADE